jgi:hypothetical protein
VTPIIVCASLDLSTRTGTRARRGSLPYPPCGCAQNPPFYSERRIRGSNPERLGCGETLSFAGGLHRLIDRDAPGGGLRTGGFDVPRDAFSELILDVKTGRDFEGEPSPCEKNPPLLHLLGADAIPGEPVGAPLAIRPGGMCVSEDGGTR